MSELAFTKTFLSSLDSRPIKLRADYVHDEGLTPRGPYTLPRLPPSHPAMAKKTKLPSTPGSSKSITIALKSARNPSLEFTIPNAPLFTTSVSDLKDAVQDRVLDNNDKKVGLDKIKILYKRKPVTGTGKTVVEVLGDETELLSGGKLVEFGVMIMGGAKVVSEGQRNLEKGKVEGVDEPVVSKATVEPSEEVLLETEEFWDDLQRFLGQKINDAEVAKRLRGLFKDAWVANR